MDPVAGFFSIFIKEQKASLERITMNTRIVLLLLPMGLIEAVINSILMLLLTPFIFARVLDNVIGRATILYKVANFDELSKSLAKEGWPRRLSKEETISRDFSIKEDKFTQAFISKTSPFIIGVLTTLLTLFFSSKL